jgi:nucleotide-binding universal stress UspA family protein
MKILLACDASEHSKAVVSETIKSPWPATSKFKVISIVDNSFLGQAPAPKLLESAQAVVKACTEQLRAGLPSQEVLDGQVITGHPKSEIIKFAEMWPTDLLIVGSRGLKGLKRHMLGSVSSAILSAVTCSVRIARQQPAPSSSNGKGRILVALDDSEFSDHVVSRITSRPWTDGTEFLFVTALPSLTDYLGELQDSHEISALEGLRRQQAAGAETHLKEVVSLIQNQLPKASAKYEIVDGDPREAVVEKAKEWGATLTVTGSKGKNWIDRVLIGSVSEAVATWSNCSVEVVKK